MHMSTKDTARFGNHFQTEVIEGDQTWLYLLCLLYVVVYFYGCMLTLLC